MPRTSERQRQPRDIEQVLDDRADAAVIRYLLDQDDELEGDVDELVHPRYIAVSSARYVARLPYRKPEDRWRVLLHDRWYMTNREFLEHFDCQEMRFGVVSSSSKTILYSSNIHTQHFLGTRSCI